VTPVKGDDGRLRYEPTGEPDVFMECDHVLMAIGQENHCPWIERDIGIEFDKWDCPKLDEATLQSTHPKVFFGGDSAFGPENIIWASAHAHKAAISIHCCCRARTSSGPAAGRRQPAQPEDGHARVELRQ
jgi:formate dehydrogenase (NADP+) beta subunit